MVQNVLELQKEVGILFILYLLQFQLAQKIIKREVMVVIIKN
jgi:hypothetical protein